jgi:O-antigen/teichoic acid export membrane protein
MPPSSSPPDSAGVATNEPLASRDTDREAAPPPAFGTRGGLRKLVMRASLFDMAGYGASQVIRLGSNMILSRLLFPEAFGLVALVNIFNQGLVLLTDVGIEPAVIQNTRGDEPAFLNTAWTIHVVRGFLLYAIALALAWPLAVIYKQPQLFWLICAGSLSVVLTGLNSTALITLRRKLALGKLALIELGSQAASVVVMITWANLHRTVWALVGGLLTSAAFRMIASHSIDVGYRNRLRSEAGARSAIFHFGKWIFASSALYFVARQGDRLLLGRFLGVAQLGIYSIAVFLSEAVSAVITRLTHGVLYPAFSRVREEGAARLRAAYYRARLALDAAALPALGILTMLGPWVVHLLYDKRYAEAGWMLQAFALRVAMSCVLVPCETCLFSTGQTRYGLYENVARMTWIVIGVPLGWHLLGLRGLVYATALSELPVFFVLWLPFRAARMLRPLLELRAASFYGAGLVVGWLLARFLHP